MSESKFRFGALSFLGALGYVALGLWGGYYVGDSFAGSYIIAWYATVLSAFTALMIASIPVKVMIMEDRIEIHCLIEARVIYFENISSVEKISPRKMRYAVPIYGSGGFMGEFGKFWMPRTQEFAQLYVTELNSILKLTMQNGDIFYISCRGRDKIVSNFRAFSSMSN